LYVARRKAARWLIRNVYLACKHPVLVGQYSQLLHRLAIKNRVMTRDWRVLVQGRDAIKRFAAKINFLPNVAVGGNSAYWEGSTGPPRWQQRAENLAVSGELSKRFETIPTEVVSLAGILTR
jgi:hypothetical protein